MGFVSTINLIRRGAQRHGKEKHGYRRLLPSYRQWEVMKSNLNKLIIYQRIQLSLVYAKELQQYAEELVNLARKSAKTCNPVERSRYLSLCNTILKSAEAREILFERLVPRYSTTNSLVTRVVNTWKFRERDTTPMGIIEFKFRSGELIPTKPDAVVISKEDLNRRERRHG